MKTVAVVQARMGSSRLPGKSLMALAGRPMLMHVLERALAVRGVDEVVLATSAAERDTALLTVAVPLGVRTHFGSEWDVLQRMHDAARWAQADVVVRITGDCPFFAPDVAEAVLDAFFSTRADYVSNDTTRSGYPDGTDAEVFTADLLEEAARLATDRDDREHVTKWMRRKSNCGVVMCAEGDFSARKLSVDRPADFAYAQGLHRYLKAGEFTLHDTLRACQMADEETRCPNG